MAFHFPLMPGCSMGLRLEDRKPITEILQKTPESPLMSMAMTNDARKWDVSNAITCMTSMPATDDAPELGIRRRLASAARP